jgi:hypothetical protein
MKFSPTREPVPPGRERSLDPAGIKLFDSYFRRDTTRVVKVTCDDAIRPRGGVG